MSEIGNIIKKIPVKIRRFFIGKRKINKKMLDNRVTVFFTFIIVVGMIMCCYGLGKLQLDRETRDYLRGLAESEHLGDTVIEAKRGTVYDANMSVLAQSIDCWTLRADPTHFQKLGPVDSGRILTEMSGIVGIKREDFEKKLSDTDSTGVDIAKELEFSQKERISEYISSFKVQDSDKKTGISGIFVLEKSVKRVYPSQTLAAQVLGCVGSDNNGLSGLESYYDGLLTGIDGRKITYTSSYGGDDAIKYISGEDAVEGSGLVLTVDESIQRYLDSALYDCYKNSKCASCYGLVMDVETGGILAMSTQPGFNPNTPHELYDAGVKEKIGKIESPQEREEAESTAVYSQWRNRAISDTYEPGSVFKVVTMAAGLEENKVEYEETFDCSGSIQVMDRVYYCSNTGGHGRQTLAEGLMNSCNPFFITIGKRLGINSFFKYFDAFGFTQKAGIDLDGEAEPVKGVTYFDRDDMTEVNLASCSFGQSFQVSALQMVTAVNAVANGGKLVRPYVVKKVLDGNGNVVSVTQPEVRRQVVSESNCRKILEAMEENSIRGTAVNSYVAGYHVGGKTGTSDKLTKEGKVVVSFVGCAPIYDPKISVLIVVDEPQGDASGGSLAAPVAAEVIENTLTYMNIERRYDDESSERFKTPALIGKNVSEAREMLEEKQVTVRVEGNGDTVVSQVPSFGSFIGKDGVVVLYTQEGAERVKVKVPNFTGMTVSQAAYEAWINGLNLNVAGNSQENSGFLAYKQNCKAGNEIEYGSEITVYFKTEVGVTDD